MSQRDMTTDHKPTLADEFLPLRCEVHGHPIIYSGNRLICAVTGWAGSSLQEEKSWAELIVSAVNAELDRRAAPEAVGERKYQGAVAGAASPGLDAIRREHAVDALLRQPAAEPSEAAVSQMRADGWVVAVHNDYMLDGKRMTFWGFSRGSEWVKGEGETDAEAVNAALRAARATAAKGEAPYPLPACRRCGNTTGICPNIGTAYEDCKRRAVAQGARHD